ncbi:hypothetical protein AcW1_008188 [Taiwanofungus camphoratus]|nr:hypothetical protein AcW1_008188 [Antrodia cinnamomea]
MHSLSLDALPVELLYEIQSYALSPDLPLACKHFYAVYKSASASVHAQFLIGRYSHYPDRTTSERGRGLVSTALRYPICDQVVLEAILRSPANPYKSLSSERKSLSPVELPRRLFRNLSPRSITNGAIVGRKEGYDTGGWREDDEPLPFLRYLYEHPQLPPPIANSYDGYALTKAVHAGFVPLVRFLLNHGASPVYKNGLAVMVAIRRKDLALVRMLIERDGTVRGDKQTKDKNDFPASAKRRKLEDRIKVNQEMLKTAVMCDARSIVEYLMKEKGCVPDMQTVLLMGR